MAKHIFLLSFLLVSTHFGVTISATYTSICNQTPYPQLCNSLTTAAAAAAATTETTLSGSLYGLRDASLRETLSRAQNVHNLLKNMDLSSFSDRAKTAWIDCVDLYEDSIYQLNRTTGSENNDFDVQTWLSATIANEQACQNGFLDFNLPSLISSASLTPFTELSKFLSNSLAINKAIYSKQIMNINRRLLAHDFFPEWVSAGDRKLLQSAGASRKGDIVVAQDGSGDYKTISEGLAAAASRRSGSKRFVIYVKKGIYKENVEVKRSMKNIMLIGDGIDATIVTASKNVHDGSTTFRSATFAATGSGFIAQGMTFENTAGAQKHQAVAVRSGSDFSVFYECSFKGYQDTLYVYSQRQFYRDCDIYGTIDFIFGDAVSVIQNCNIYIRQPMSNQRATVTAQGRKDPNENTGIVIHNSHVAKAAGSSSWKSYLGRPWQKYSTTVFIKCTIDGVIDPAGWLPWSGSFGLSTLYYGEYMNTGAGAATGGRVKWPGFHIITSAAEAGKFSVGSFLAGGSWLPATGVPFASGL